jgi:hypothetical protein
LQASEISSEEAEDVREGREEPEIKVVSGPLQAWSRYCVSQSWQNSAGCFVTFLSGQRLARFLMIGEIAFGKQDRPVTEDSRRIDVEVYLAVSPFGG